MTVSAQFSRFRLLQLRRLRKRGLRSVLSLLGVATGVALVVGVVSLFTSVSATAGSVAELNEGGSYIVVRPGGFEPAAVDRIASAEQVTGVSRSVSAPVLIDGEAGWLIGVEQSSQLQGVASALAAVTSPQSGSREPETGSVQITGFDGVSRPVTIANRAEASLRGRLGGRFIAAPIDVVAEASGLGRPSSVIVFGDPDRADLLAAAGPGASVKTPADQIASAEGALTPIISSLLLISLMGIVVGAVLVFNTVNTNALENRNETAVLRTLGSDKSSVRTGALLEGLLIGSVGSAAGVLLGLGIGASAIETVPDAFSNLVGSPIEFAVAWWLPMLGLVVGTALAAVSVIGPIRAVGRIEPIEGVRRVEESDVETVPTSMPQLVIGAMAVVASAVIGEGVGLVLAVVGTILVLRSVRRWLPQFVAAVAGRWGSAGQITALSVARSPRRLWSSGLVLLLCVGISMMTVGALNDFSRTSEADLSTVGAPTFWVSTVSGDSVPVVGLPVEWGDEITGVAGVVDVAASRFLTTGFRGKETGVLGVEGGSAYSYYALASDDAQRAVTEGTGIIVNRQFAQAYSVGVDDEIAVPGSNPERVVPIVAVTEGQAVAEGGLVVISAATMEELFGVESFGSFEVTAEPDAAEHVERELTAMADDARFPVRVIPAAEFLDDALVSVGQIKSVIFLILFVIGLCAGIAIFNTFAATVVARKREFAVLRAIGTTRSQIRRSVFVEAIAIGVSFGLVGALLGSYLHFLASDALSGVFHIEHRFSASVFVGSILLGIAVVVIGSWLPVRRGTKGDTFESLSVE